MRARLEVLARLQLYPLLAGAEVLVEMAQSVPRDWHEYINEFEIYDFGGGR